MSRLDQDQDVLLELLAMRPLSYLPPFHAQVAAELQTCGLIVCDTAHWRLTAAGWRALADWSTEGWPAAHQSIPKPA
jgi:hypothetical protein